MRPEVISKYNFRPAELPANKERHHVFVLGCMAPSRRVSSSLFQTSTNTLELIDRSPLRQQLWNVWTRATLNWQHATAGWMRSACLGGRMNGCEERVGNWDEKGWEKGGGLLEKLD